METQKETIYEDKDFQCYKIGRIGVIKIIKNIFEIVTDLPESSNFISVMNDLENDKTVEAILFLNEKGSLGNEEYLTYLKQVLAHNEMGKEWSNIEITNRKTRTRELVILNTIITKIVLSEKLIVTGLRGEIVTPFFGASLAADIRFATDDVVFLLSHLQMNIHPSGALPFFLPRYIGHAKASQILFNGEEVTVTEAMELGIIQEILPIENYEELCIEKINRILLKGENVISCTKKLLNFNFEDLDNYLGMEECNYIRR